MQSDWWQIVVISLLSGLGWRLGGELMESEQGIKWMFSVIVVLLVSTGIFGIIGIPRVSNMGRIDTNVQNSHTSVHNNHTSVHTSTTTSTHRLEERFLSLELESEEPFNEAVKARLAAYNLPACPEVTDELFYRSVYKKNCEAVIGKVQVPVGLVGPIKLPGGRERFLPLATVEGALVASVNRGCKALALASKLSVVQSGVQGMTRGPCIEAESLEQARDWLADFCDSAKLPHWKMIFDQSSPGGHINLREISGRQVGRLVYLRFKAECGEAMGMNMMSRGCEYFLSRVLPPGTKYCLSGNYCTDKKPSAINWIEGRGRTVIVEVIIPPEVMSSVLKVDDLNGFCKFAMQKNLIGSAVAGSVGGFNAHVANTVAAAYLATGQDVAQVVDASAAITLVEPCDNGGIRVSLTIPCVEAGFRGGGTGLPLQQHFLKQISGCEGPDEFAQVITIGALGGEISLLAALFNQGELVQSHTELNK